MSPEVERQLREYLREDGPEADRRREVARDVRELAEAFRQHLVDDAKMLATLEAEQKAIKGRVDDLESAAEVTGVRSVEELKARYREERDGRVERERFWRNLRWGAIASAATGIGGYCARLIFGG